MGKEPVVDMVQHYINEGLEIAARWHDEQADEARKRAAAESSEIRFNWETIAAAHERDAAAIRELKEE